MGLVMPPSSSSLNCSLARAANCKLVLTTNIEAPFDLSRLSIALK